MRTLTPKQAAIANECLDRATSGQSTMNYGPIIMGFAARGIAMNDIKPRENIFTYNAWLAKGRQVRKGEHGVKAVTFVPMTVKDKRDPSKKVESRRPWTTTVFHISQTDPIQ